jgi:SpoIID/LytB domain protein
MGQWGAYGQASRGVSYRRILAHYYRGTKLVQAPAKPVRVLLWEGKGRYAVTSPVPFSLVDAEGATYDLQPGRYVVGRELEVALDSAQPARALPGPLTFRPGKEPLEAGAAKAAARPYRGSVQLQLVEDRLQAVNDVGLDAYVRGVVSEEVPDDWPIEAVKAQAVAARSYALAQRRDGVVLFADVRSQVYGGIEAESPLGDRAVAETKRQVLTYGGRVATTYFFASSGGRTAAVKDVFIGAKPIPYLVSVQDPDDRFSPYHRWGPVVFASARVSKLLGLPGVSDLRTVPRGGRAREVVVTAKSGETTLRSSDVRLRLGLRSTWFSPGVLSLSRPAGTPAAGSPVTITGAVRRVKGPVVLERRVAGGVWEEAAEVRLAADRSFSVEVTPAVTTFYRLAAGEVRSSPLRVAVAPIRRAAVLQAASGPLGATSSQSAAFVPDDPLAPRQWYLSRIRAFDFWPVLPQLAPVRVAVIDTGIDLDHPELAGRVVAAKSFVGGAVDDEIGHGTFVAGEIAAALGNGQGIAGIAFPAQLVVAKVVGRDGDIDAEVEARAIRWAVWKGARVINLSIGGLRDPVQRSRDTFSQAEADAVAYARSKGAVVVAAVGNGDQAPHSPWWYASYPAALPHVIGVSALAEDGSVPTFSNRDVVYNDVAAPGNAIVSTLPLALTEGRPTCPEQGYSLCGPAEYRVGAGTSFAAAQVSAAAALLLAVRSDLTADQVRSVLERAAVDASPATGCKKCLIGRDAYSGWGGLDVTAALEALGRKLPTADRYEANDDAGPYAAPLWGSRTIVAQATLDFWDDQIDVYRVRVRRGQQLVVTLRGAAGTDPNLVLWRPGTTHVEGLSAKIQRQRVTQSARSGPNEVLVHRARQNGWYFVEVKMAAPGTGRYTLRIEKRA